MDRPPVLLLIAIGVVLLMGIVMFVSIAGTFRLWLMALLSGTPISMMRIVGMKLRRSDAKKIVAAMIQMNQGGVRVPIFKIESADLAGADVAKIALAAVTLARREQPVDIDSLIAASLEERLEDEVRATETN